MPSGADTVRKLIRGFDKGMYSRMEVLSRLVEEASTSRPADLAGALPANWLAEVRTATAKPPSSIDDVCIVSGAIYRNAAEHEAHKAEMRRAWFEGAWNWHRFLEPEK